MAFHELHVEPLLDDVDVVCVSSMPAGKHDDDSVIGERADRGDVKVDDGAGICRHPFALYSRLEKVWKAHRRLVIAVGDSMDQELMDAYAANNA